MLENQVKNTIKLSLFALLASAIGEGVFSLGLFWPYLILLLDWNGIYWLAFGIGVLVSVFNGLAIGIPSLLLVLFVGIFSLSFGGRRDMPLIETIVLVIANIIFDKLLGLPYSIYEMMTVFIFCILVFGRGEKSESIHIKYRQ